MKLRQRKAVNLNENSVPTPLADSNRRYHFQVRTSDGHPWEDKFSALMKQQVCGHPGCTRMNIVGIERCEDHMSMDFGVRICPSQYGQGLVTTRAFAANEEFAFLYVGEVITHREKFRRYGRYTAPYTMDNSDSHQREPTCVDAALVRGVASIINHSDTPNVKASMTVNDRGVTIIKLMTLTDIPIAQELFLNYNAGHGSQHAQHYQFNKNERNTITFDNEGGNPPLKKSRRKSQV